MNWIPMSEKKPSEEGFYLITYHHDTWNDEFIDVDYWDEVGEYWGDHNDTVTAWSELPEPYRKVQK